MARLCFKRHRFRPEVIRLAVWLCFRFTLSIRDVEEMLAQRGIEFSRRGGAGQAGCRLHDLNCVAIVCGYRILK